MKKALVFILLIINQVSMAGEIPIEDVERRVIELNQRLEEKGLRWKAGVTSMTHLTDEEFKKLCGRDYDPSKLVEDLERQEQVLNEYLLQKENSKIIKESMSSINWSSYMSPIETQSCGDCWSHAATGVVEGLFHRFKSVSPKIDLYETNITENATCGNCSQGAQYLNCGFSYIQNFKVTAENDYSNAFYYINSYSYDSNPTISEIKSSLSSSPVATEMLVYDDFKNHYTSGIYEYDGVSQGPLAIHAVVIVNYNDTEGYWVCKNSWGTGWGENGYCKIAYGQCGIDSGQSVTAVINHEKYYAKVLPRFLSNLSNALSYPFVTDEKCYVDGAITLTSNASVPTDGYLNILSSATINLNNKFIKSVGGIIDTQSGAIFCPSNYVYVKAGNAIKGYYPTVSSACANASGGEIVYVFLPVTLINNVTVPDGVTLRFESGSTIKGCFNRPS